MKKTLLSILIASPILLAGTAFAEHGHHGPPGPEDRFQEMDLNGDGVVTRAEATKHRQDRFAEADANGDGLISFDEAMAQFKERSADKEHGPRPPGNPVAMMFAHMDIDGDGFISEEETQVMSDRFFKDMDANLDGKVTLLEAKAAIKDKMKDGDHEWKHDRR